MALVTQFDTPGSLRDMPAGSPFFTQWHNYLAGQLTRVTPGSVGEFYDPSEINVDPLAEHTLTWMGFPRRELVAGHRDDRRAAFTASESRPVQDEYFEWHVTKNSADKITKVVFVTETPEYWELIAKVDRARLVALYRAIVNPAVVEADLFTAGPISWAAQFTDGSGQFYNRQNRWNTTDGILHYIQTINTLNAALGLSQGSVNSHGARDNYEMPQSPATNVDPRVGMDIGSLGRKPLSITLREPIGLYMAGWNDTGWTKPDGLPVGDYWRVVRGVRGAALRVEYQVPASEGFVVGDIRIGGRRIEWGGQIAEHITVMVGGIAGRRAR